MRKCVLENFCPSVSCWAMQLLLSIEQCFGIPSHPIPFSSWMLRLTSRSINILRRFQLCSQNHAGLGCSFWRGRSVLAAAPDKRRCPALCAEQGTPALLLFKALAVLSWPTAPCSADCTLASMLCHGGWTWTSRYWWKGNLGMVFFEWIVFRCVCVVVEGGGKGVLSLTPSIFWFVFAVAERVVWGSISSRRTSQKAAFVSQLLSW